VSLILTNFTNAFVIPWPIFHTKELGRLVHVSTPILLWNFHAFTPSSFPFHKERRYKAAPELTIRLQLFSPH